MSSTETIEAHLHQRLLDWLHESDPERLHVLWSAADQCRQQHVGDAVHLRGLVEISNHCVRMCGYCGLRAGNGSIARYRMSLMEIVACARRALEFGYGTVVLQAGEDPGLTREFVADIVRAIKVETGLAVTLSLGERGLDELTAWKEAGADRYLLRFETSNADLFQAIHPRGRSPWPNRVALLHELRSLGYEVGSGIMVGIPGQTWDTLVDDVLLFNELRLDMIGVGPFIAHPKTPLAQKVHGEDVTSEQVPATEEMTYKLVALARLACPPANIPSTTALATLNIATGREQGLTRGANVVMPNLTPTEYRAHYEIYPGKACIQEDSDDCHRCMKNRIHGIGRQPGEGPGGAPERGDLERASRLNGFLERLPPKPDSTPAQPKRPKLHVLSR